MPGGEALARQLVHGKRFFLDELGIETEEVWLPDSFGYTAAFPQLAKLAGVTWFLTQKLSWNQTNKLPHHTFWWEGIDGTRVFTHFPPVDTYNAELSGAELAHAGAQLRRQGPGEPLPGAVRATATAAAAPPARCWSGRAGSRDLEGSPRVEIEHAVGVLRRGARGVRRPPPVWSASCTWSCTAPRTPPRPRPSRATGAANTCCARPSCGPRPPRCRSRVRRTRTTSWTGCGRRCCCTSSTTSCPAPRSPGCTARPGDVRDGSPRELEEIDRRPRWAR